MTKTEKNIKSTIPEKQIQRDIARLLDMKGILWIHSANEGSRSSALEGRLLKLAGVKAGFPDIVIFDPPPNKPSFKGAALELKSESGSLSGSQKQWLDDLSNRGWLCACSHGLDEAIDILESWGYL